MWLAHNKIFEIESLRVLKKLTTLSVFHNDIYHADQFLTVLADFPNLEEVAVDGNPMAKDYGLKYRIIMSTKVKIIDDEKVTELD